MTVYVDDMYKYPMGQFRRMKMSHMVADTETELHEMAARIGVARRWYQGDHYDICMSMRTKAVSFGAVEITLRELALRHREARREAFRFSGSAVRRDPLSLPESQFWPNDAISGQLGRRIGKD